MRWDGRRHPARGCKASASPRVRGRRLPAGRQRRPRPSPRFSQIEGNRRMASLRSLLERRAAVKTRLQGILEQHPDTLPPEQQTEWDSLTGEADTLEQRIGMQARVDEIERRIAGAPAGGGAPSR